MNAEQLRLHALWASVGSPGTFEAWLACYYELDRLYRENAVARQLGADKIEIEFYESEIRKYERRVGA